MTGQEASLSCCDFWVNYYCCNSSVRNVLGDIYAVKPLCRIISISHFFCTVATIGGGFFSTCCCDVVSIPCHRTTAPCSAISFYREVHSGSVFSDADDVKLWYLNTRSVGSVSMKSAQVNFIRIISFLWLLQIFKLSANKTGPFINNVLSEDRIGSSVPRRPWGNHRWVNECLRRWLWRNKITATTPLRIFIGI